MRTPTAYPLLCLALAPWLVQAQTRFPDTLAGAWRFVDDGTVVEFVACGAATCALVRALPPMPDPKDGPPPACGEAVILDLRRDPAAARWLGQVVDTSDNKRYQARLQPGKNGRLNLVITALGGLFSETLTMEPAPAGFKACAIP